MNRQAIQLLITGLLLLTSLVQMFYFYPRLPNTVASHFGASGRPDQWLSKETHLAFHIAAVVLLATLSISARWIRKIPTRFINLPNKDYWLAPERRGQSLETICIMVGWIGNASFALIVGVMQMVLLTNLSPAPHLGSAVWWMLALYCVALVFWLWKIFRQFGSPSKRRTGRQS